MPIDPLTAAVAATLWAADKAAGAILSEYSKRCWFSKEHALKILKAYEEIEKAREVLEREKQEFSLSKIRVSELLTELDRQLGENIRLKALLKVQEKFSDKTIHCNDAHADGQKNIIQFDSESSPVTNHSSDKQA